MFQSDAAKLYTIGRYGTIAARVNRLSSRVLNVYWSGDLQVLDMLQVVKYCLDVCLLRAARTCLSALAHFLSSLALVQILSRYCQTSRILAS